jgi:glutamine amidotransferase
VIIDYGIGNLRSVAKAIENVGGKTKISADPGHLRQSDGIVLPGVGAFRDAQKHLHGTIQYLKDEVEAGKPLLGICLGLQLLFTESTEGGIYKGLDIIKGRVVRFPAGPKIPHVGWNTLRIVDDDCALLQDVPCNSYAYFVHSYYGIVDRREDVAAETCYNVNFPSVVSRKNVYATQFHPEKSGSIGLRILRNFMNIITQ